MRCVTCNKKVSGYGKYCSAHMKKLLGDIFEECIVDKYATAGIDVRKDYLKNLPDRVG